MNKKNENLPKSIVPIVLAGSIVAFGLPFVVYWNVAGFQFPTPNPARLGEIGDFFGGLSNPIFGFTSTLVLVFGLLYEAKQVREMMRISQNQSKLSEQQYLLAQNEAKLNQLLMLLDAIDQDLEEKLSNQPEIVTLPDIVYANVTLESFLSIKKYTDIHKHSQGYFDYFRSPLKRRYLILKEIEKIDIGTPLVLKTTKWKMHPLNSFFYNTDLFTDEETSFLEDWE